MIDNKKTKKRMFSGKVISDSMNKTVVVSLERSHNHPLLSKVVRSSKKYKVHDENNTAKVGDIVEFYEGRPVSKTKCMYLNRIL